MSDWKQARPESVNGTVAPTIATALGGPLAGLATAAIAGAFGLGNGVSKSQLAAAPVGCTAGAPVRGLRGGGVARCDFVFWLALAGVSIDPLVMGLVTCIWTGATLRCATSAVPAALRHAQQCKNPH